MVPHPPFLTFSLNIARLDGIYYTITIILELESPILLQELGLALLITFLCGGGLPIFLNVVTELPHRSRLSIYRRLRRRVPKLFFKIIPIIYVITLVTPFKRHWTCLRGWPVSPGVQFRSCSYSLHKNREGRGWVIIKTTGYAFSRKFTPMDDINILPFF